jgi:hypothetical protein
MSVSSTTFVNDSFIPAKDASAVSSAVADERTATRAPSPSSLNASITADRTSSGTPADCTEARSSSEASLRAPESSMSAFATMSRTR